MARDRHRWRRGAHYRYRLRAVPMDRDLAGCDIWFVRPREKEDRTRCFCRPAVGDGCGPAHCSRLLDLFGRRRKDDGMDAVCAHAHRTASFRRGNGAAAALLCAGGRPDGAVHARFRTVHRADNHAVTEHIRVQGIGLAGSARRLRAHLDSTRRIRCGIGSRFETREGELTVKALLYRHNGHFRPMGRKWPFFVCGVIWQLKVPS